MYKQADPDQDLAAYVAKLIEALLRNLAFSIRQVLEKDDEESVRDLRIHCLRLRHALRLFARMLPARPARKIERRVGRLRDLVSAVYAYDRALDTLGLESIASQAGPRRAKRLAIELAAARRRALRPLRLRLRRMQRADVFQRWRTRLSPSG